MIKTNENKIICRKCQGPHFTVKCNQYNNNNNNKIQEEIINNNKKQEEIINNNKKQEEIINNNKKQEDTINNNKNNYNKIQEDKNNKKYDKNNDRKKYFKTTYKVKLSELPTNITEEEMMELTSEWGHIVRIKVLNYEESSNVYIDFGYEEEANYFVKALDKTPFDNIIISASRIE